jgi:hypothetical protein
MKYVVRSLFPVFFASTAYAGNEAVEEALQEFLDFAT